MLRLPPSWISLGEDEVQWYLNRVSLQSLPDLSKLHLDDRDECAKDDQPLVDPSDGNASGESGQEHPLGSVHSLARASSCSNHSSVNTTASAHHSVSNNAPASTPQVSSLLQHQAYQPAERPFCHKPPIILSRNVQDHGRPHHRDQGLFDLRVIVRLVSGD